MSDVLFVCIHNAGRSQMARALFNRMAAGRGLSLKAGSAGTDPASGVHDNVVEAMAEIGIDLSNARPVTLSDEMVETAGRVITMGCAVDDAQCPAIAMRDVEDWGLPDPAGRSAEEVRAVRDRIAERVEHLIDSLASRS